MTQSRVAVQDIEFAGHRAAVLAVYESDGAGRYSFSRFELIEKKRRGRKPGKRRGRPPGKRRKNAVAKKE